MNPETLYSKVMLEVYRILVSLVECSSLLHAEDSLAVYVCPLDWLDETLPSLQP